MHHKILAQVFCWAMLLSLSWGATASSTSVAGQFFVSPDGNDAWSGRRATKALWSQEGPFVSLSRALSAARETKAGNPEQPVTIFLRGGTYFLEKPLVLTPADSHIAAGEFRGGRKRGVAGGGFGLLTCQKCVPVSGLLWSYGQTANVQFVLANPIVATWRLQGCRTRLLIGPMDNTALSS